MMWRRSFSRPGLLRAAVGEPFLAALPALPGPVVKPRISTLTWQRSSVRASTSAQIAAIEIGRPRIEPELSSSSVTTVSRNSVSFSTLKDSGVVGLATTRASRPASRMPSSRSNSQLRFCCACSRRCSLLASRPTAPFSGSSCWSR
jgi:hypothetical protein